MKPASALLALAFATSWCSMAQAQAPTFPKTITLVVPFAPGASNDTFARLLAERLGPKLGSTIIIDNKPGAGGAIGAQAVARAKPDGGTLMLTSPTFTTSAATQRNLPFDPVGASRPWQCWRRVR